MSYEPWAMSYEQLNCKLKTAQSPLLTAKKIKL